MPGITKNQHYEEEMLKLSKAQSKKYWDRQKEKRMDTHFHPDEWYVILDNDGRIYVSDHSQNCVAEFETESEAWSYIHRCREHGIDF